MHYKLRCQIGFYNPYKPNEGDLIYKEWEEELPDDESAFQKMEEVMSLVRNELVSKGFKINHDSKGYKAIYYDA